MDYETNICSWNVRTLHKSGRLEDLRKILQTYKSDITALQEIRWKGKGELEDKSKYQCDLYYSCPLNKHEFGVGFAVRGKVRHCVTRWTPINERICILRVKAKFYNISLICAHAPTEDKDDEAKDIFYQQLETAFESLPAYDMKLVLGDFNAKVGKEDIFSGTIGKHSLHNTTNDNGLRLITFAASRNLVVSSTFFPHLNIHKITWNSPDGITRNQIDHVLTDRRHSSSVLDVRSMRGANIDSDHHLIRARVRCRISSKRPINNRQRKYNLDALKTTETAKKLEEYISSKLGSIQDTTEINSHWNICAEVIKTAATEILGEQEQPRRNGWRDEEYDRAVAAKDQAYRKYLQRYTRASREEYRAKRREASKIYRQKKRRFQKNCMENLEILRDRNEVRRFYQNVNKQRKGFVPTSTACNDKSGNLITNKQEILRRWEEFFSELLNGNDNRMTPQYEDCSQFQNTEDVPPPTITEVDFAIQKMKNHKSPGSDGIPAELFKVAGSSFIRAFHQLLLKIWIKEEMPEEWNVSIICPIHKKGDRKDCNNYRGISLLNIAYKIFASIMCERLKPHVIRIIGPYQCGFMPGKSTTDQIFTLRQILEKTQEHQVDTHHLFVDFKQAYDTPNRNELFAAMNKFNIPMKLIKLSRMTLQNTVSCVKSAGNTTNTFSTVRGFRQGDALSCSFFNILLEMIVNTARRATANNIGTENIFQSSRQILAYADDIDIIGRAKRELEQQFLAIEEAAGRMGLRVNEGKTQYMLSSRRDANHRELGPNVSIGNYNFKVVQNFIYLGTEVNNTNDITTEVKRRIMLANRCLYGLSNLLRSKQLSRTTKVRLYHQLIMPVLLYGAESWNLKKDHENMLLVFERKVLRKIFGAVHVEGEWRSRYNRELYQLYQHPDIVKKIRTKRLHWAGHVQRMEVEAPPRKILFTNPNINRRQGRPRTRWIDIVNSDVRKIGVNNWRTTANNRGVWRQMIDQAESA